MSVLLITGDREQAVLLEQAFAQGGHTYHFVTELKYIMGALQQGQYDVAIVDLDLPHFDGLSLVGHIWRESPDLAILTFGAAEQPVKGEAALRAGVLSHFPDCGDVDALLLAAQLASGQRYSKPYAMARQVMSTLSQLAVLAAENPGPDEFLERALVTLVSHFDADRGSLYVLRDSGGEPVLEVGAAWGLDPAYLKPVKPGQGVTGLVFTNARSQLMLSDATRQPGFESCKGINEVRASMSVPVVRKQQVEGVINITSLREHAIYTPRDLEALEFFAASVAEMLRQSALRAAQTELRTQLEASEKLALVGELTAGIGHEIKNPLSFTRSNLQVLREYVESMVPLLEWMSERSGDMPEELQTLFRASEAAELMEDGLPLIDECFDGVQRSLDITDDLKEMLHAQGPTEFAATEAAELVRQALKMVHSRLAQVARVETRLDENARIQGNGTQLVQVLVNLLNNSVDAINSRFGETEDMPGRIEIVVYRTESGVTLQVSDNGCGMDRDVKKRAFDPLFTTKSREAGTGLGLGIVNRIVTLHGGRLVVESEKGRGTTMRIHFSAGQD